MSEVAWRSGETQRLAEAWAACDRAMAGLPEERLAVEAGAAFQDPFRAERAAIWLMRGRVMVSRDTPESVSEGLRCFDQAILRMKDTGATGGPAGTELAIIWMNRGSALLRLGAPDALKEAVRSYDQAIELLETAPEGFENALGTSWMNRGVGLMRAGGDDALAEAGRSLERAVTVLEPLVAAQPEVRRNVAAAWANRGVVLSLENDAAGAVRAHRQAVEAFRPLTQNDNPAGCREFAALLLNLGQAAGAAGDVDGALAATRDALALVSPAETEDPHSAVMTLRARHALCVTLGGLVAKNQGENAARSAHLAEAGDVVEDGLALVRSLEGNGVPPAEEGARLFEFGAWLYRTQQPQFLAEFLLEHLGEDPVRARIAASAVRLARQAIVQRGFSDGRGEAAEILAGLGEVDARLRVIASAEAASQPRST